MKNRTSLGAVITSTAQIISELTVDWTTPKGQALSALLVSPPLKKLMPDLI